MGQCCSTDGNVGFYSKTRYVKRLYDHVYAACKPGTRKDKTMKPIIFAAVLSAAASLPHSSEAASLKNKFGLCLTVANDSKEEKGSIEQFACKGYDGQSWEFDGRKIVNTFGLCLTVAGNNTANKATIEQFPCRGYDGQKWTLRDDGQIENELGKCLSVSGDTNEPKAVIEQYSCNGSKGQVWEAE